jgi:hypothetical protein
MSGDSRNVIKLCKFMLSIIRLSVVFLITIVSVVVLSFVMLSVLMVGIITMSVIVLVVVMLSIIGMSIVILCFIVRLSVIMLSVIALNVVAPPFGKTGRYSDGKMVTFKLDVPCQRNIREKRNKFQFQFFIQFFFQKIEKYMFSF